MNAQVMSGIIAIGIGLLVGFGLFVLFVAISCRRRARLSPVRPSLAEAGAPRLSLASGAHRRP